MSDERSVFRAVGASVRAAGVSKEEREADLGRRARNAALKAACEVEHKAEQLAEREGLITEILGEYSTVVTRDDLVRLRCQQLRDWAGLARERTQDRAATEAVRAARVAALPEAARVAYHTTIRELAETAEIDKLAMELFGVEGDEYVYADRNTGMQDPYRSESNRMKARSAARLVAAGRKRFEDRTRPLREHREAHRAAAQSVGMFGSVGLQLARSKVRDEAGGGIYGTRGLRSREPLPVQADGATPDPYARRIEQLRAAQVKKDEAREARNRRR